MERRRDGRSARLMVSKLPAFSDRHLHLVRAALLAEMERRKMSVNVGQIAEELAIAHFNRTPGLPNLLATAPNTTHVDAISRNGERYAVKGLCRGRKTGAIYMNPDPEVRIFEYLLLVQLEPDWTLKSIHQFDWDAFRACRRWTKWTGSWYMSNNKATLERAVRVFPISAA